MIAQTVGGTITGVLIRGSLGYDRARAHNTKTCLQVNTTITHSTTLHGSN
jgi:hypothetical protein